MSLKEAKIRATPKTSSPVIGGGHVSIYIYTYISWCKSILTVSDLRAEGDVLLGGARCFLGRHVVVSMLLVSVGFARKKKKRIGNIPVCDDLFAVNEAWGHWLVGHGKFVENGSE